MKSQSTKNPVRIIPCGALFESYGQTLDPSKYCPELPEAQCMLAEDGLYLRLQEKARPPTEKSIPVFDGLSISGRASVHYFAAGTIFSLPFM